jgi:putative membrane protein insertion efficiency factor
MPGGDGVKRAFQARFRRRLAGILAVLFLALAMDVSRAPADQWSARVALGAIDVYQATLSKVFARAGTECRFHPTCSHYAEGAIRKHGMLVGSLRTGKRLLRCGPWTPADTYDPP